MTEAAEETKKRKWFSDWTDETLAFLVLRVWLSMRAIITGIEKFSGIKIEKRPLLDDLGMEDISGKMIEVKTKAYALADYHAVPPALQAAFAKEPLLPAFLTAPYYAVLGPALIVMGMMLLTGIGTRTSLFLMGLMYASLTFGLILIKEDGGISWLGVHVIMVVMALVLAKHNRLAVLKKF